MSAYSKLLEDIEQLCILDTHEHLPVHPCQRKHPCDLLTEYLSHYFDKDLLSSGMPLAHLHAAMDTQTTIAQRFSLLAPWWDICRTTGYGQSLDLVARDLYGVRAINQDNIEQMDAQFQKGAHDPTYFRQILKDKCRIARSINDGFQHNNEPGWSDDELFIQVRRLDAYLNEWEFVWPCIQKTGVVVTDLESFLEAVRLDMLASPGYGYAGFKLGVAYSRSLDFAKPDITLARAQFDACFAQFGKQARLSLPLELQNLILHTCLNTLCDMDSFLQIHTGYQEGNGNIVSNTDPLHLTALLMQYPQIRFDLFHVGYPYWEQMGVLGKLFPNVTVDFAWVNIMSPAIAQRALSTYLDLMPRNKILAFGGDYLFVDGVYAHQKMARRAVAHVLAQRVEDGQFDHEEALRTAKMLLHDNAMERLNLKL